MFYGLKKGTAMLMGANLAKNLHLLERDVGAVPGHTIRRICETLPSSNGDVVHTLLESILCCDTADVWHTSAMSMSMALPSWT